MTIEPVTVVLSEAGWVRAAKGHEVDAAGLAYKSGDKLKLLAKGKSNQNAVFLDSTGRAYTLPAHSLPSARGQGEPLTGRVNPPSGATFEGLVIGDPETLYLIASDAGYGFISTFENLISKNRSGKAVLSLPKGSKVLSPVAVNNLQTDEVVGVTNEGRLLMFKIAELPELAKGKGNKLISIPGGRVAERQEYVVGFAVLDRSKYLLVHSGKRFIRLTLEELEHYRGERGRRGNKLPRGFQKVDMVEVQDK
jgi:topoisomerase-4 subunit A